MDFFSKQKIYLWLIILLVLLNITVLAVIWTGKPECPPPPEKRKPQVNRFLSDELKLTNEQEQQFDKLRKQHFLEVDSLIKEINKKKIEINDYIFSKEIDELTIAGLIDSMGNLNTRLENLRINHFIKIKSVLTEEQLKHFRRMIQEPMNPIRGKNLETPPLHEGKVPVGPGIFPPPPHN